MKEGHVMAINWFETLRKRITRDFSSRLLLRKQRARRRRQESPALAYAQIRILEDRCLLTAFNPVAGAVDGSTGSLRDVIQTANSNSQDDVVTLNAGVYTLDIANTANLQENAAASGDLDLIEAGFRIDFVGAGEDQTFISQTAVDRVFQVFAGVTVSFTGLTITNGQAVDNGDPLASAGTGDGNGGGILNEGVLSLNQTSLKNNSAIGDDAGEGGGGLFNAGDVDITGGVIASNLASGVAGSGGGILNASGGSLVATNTFITSNIANRAGGGIEDSSGGGTVNVRLFNSMLTGNNAGVGPLAVAAPGNGGGLHISGDGGALIDGGVVANNVAGSEGGGLWNSVGLMTVRNGTIVQSNTAYGDAADNGGGGIFNNGGTVNVIDSTISRNAAVGVSGSGGGVFSTDGMFRLINTDVLGNAANRAGGGAEIIDGGIYIFESTVSANIAGPGDTAAPGNGGALHVSGTATSSVVTDSVVTGNIAAREGGGLWNQSGSSTLSITGSTLTGNTAYGDGADDGGGGVFNNGGTVVIRTSAIDSNQATGTSGSGGGLLSLDGRIDITDSSLSGNVANRAGGGIEIVDGTLVFRTGALNNNIAGLGGSAAPGNGGGLHVTGTAGTFVRVTQSDVKRNSAASEGGGLWNQAGSQMVVGNSQVVGNTADGDAADNGGGGIFNNGGSLVVARTNVSQNVASGVSGSGGGIFSTDGNVEVRVSRISGNTANRAGGGVEVIDGSFEIYSSTMIGNVAGPAGTAAPGNGGALHVSGMSGTNVVVTDTDVLNNTAASEGGGLWNQAGSVMFVRSSFVSGNSAFGIDPDNGGGGIFNNGGMTTVFNSTVSRNYAEVNGGAIFNLLGSELLVSQSSLNDNVAGNAGGGLYNDADATVAKSNIVKNTAMTGGGVYDDDDGTTILNNATVTQNLPDNRVVI